MKKFNILILAPFHFIKLPNKLKKNKNFNFLFKYKEENKLIPKIKSKIDGLITDPGASYKIDKKFLKEFTNLKVIVTPSTGINHIDINYCKINRIKFFCLLDERKTLNTITASAEFTFLLILLALRKFKKVIKYDLIKWRKSENQLRGNELYNKKIGIIGYGRIGKKINKFCLPFKASSIFYDPFIKKYDKKIIKKTNRIDFIFKQSDIVVICPYLNESSRNLIDYSKLKLMKKNSILINTSRGEIIKENDLIKLISKRKDIFINLDVIYNEQNILKNNKIINLSKKNNNLFITPHIAGLTFESQNKAGVFAINKITSYLKK